MSPASPERMFACARESRSVGQARRRIRHSRAYPDRSRSPAVAATSGFFRYKRRGERSIRIWQQVQELHFSEIANQLNAGERRVVHPNPPEVRELQPHEIAEYGADDVAVRDKHDAP